jgi:hypothetical protein
MKIIDSGVVYKNEKPSLTYFQARQPSVRVLSDLEYLCAYNHGTALESVDNTLATVRTVDGGKSWTHEGFVFDKDKDAPPSYSYFSPHIGTMKDGGLGILSVRWRRNDPMEHVYNPDTGGILPAETTYFLSEDKGMNWQGPTIIAMPEGFMGYGCGPILETAEGRWMVAFETWKAHGDRSPQKCRNFVLFSEDRGKTWGDEAVIIDDPAGKKVFWDSIFSVHEDGTILGLMWTHDLKTAKDLPLHRSYSKDHGRTWTTPEPTNLQGQMNHTIKLPDGRLMVIFNRRNCDDPGVYATCSEDMGLTWDVENSIQIWDALAGAHMGQRKDGSFLENLASFAFGCPEVRMIDDKTVIAVFWATENLITHVRWCKLAL